VNFHDRHVAFRQRYTLWNKFEHKSRIDIECSSQFNMIDVTRSHRDSLFLFAQVENGVDDQLAACIVQLSQPPPPQPPRRRKRDLYEDPSIFDQVDQQAITVAESEQTSYTELIDQLTYGLLTDLEKAR
jgi:hypothetical protein